MRIDCTLDDGPHCLLRFAGSFSRSDGALTRNIELGCVAFEHDILLVVSTVPSDGDVLWPDRPPKQ